MDGRKTTFLLGDNFSVAMLNFGGVTPANPPIVVIVVQDSGFSVHVSCEKRRSAVEVIV